MAKKELKKGFVDNGDGTVSDSETGLMWAKDGSPNRLIFKEAEKYCKSFKLADHKDWRLPTIKELISIINYEKTGPAIDSVFKCESSYYWSSTAYAGSSDHAWIVVFDGGYVGWGLRSDGCFVRPVRQY